MKLKWKRANPNSNRLVRELEKSIGIVASLMRNDVRKMEKRVKRFEKMRHG